MESSLRAAALTGEVDLTVINPIGLPPWPLSRRAPYREHDAAPAESALAGAPIHHPRFTTLPGLADANPAAIARAVRKLVRRLHDEAPFDLIDAQFLFPDGPAVAILARELGLPFTLKARGADVHFWGARPSARRQIIAAASGAAGILAVSAALKGDLVALGVPAGKVRVHHTGIDHARFRPLPRAEARAALALPTGDPLFVATGALIARKGQGLAIEALALLTAGHLALAGTGPDEAALRALAARLGVEPRVHFLGRVDHDALPLLLSAADALVLPSASEGIANAWIEALACGAPLVIPDAGGAREVVTGPNAGRIVAREAGAIAAAMAELSADPPSQTAVAAYAARFSWERNGGELVQFWREMTS